jgi:hypothetical protein
VSGWCTGIRPIPAHHVPAIIRLTDNPPPRAGPAWRPPADMPAGRSKGWHSKVSQQRRAARAERPEPLQRQPARFVRPDRPAEADSHRTIRAPAVKPAIDRAAPLLRRESAVRVPRLDLSALTDLLKPAGPPIAGNGANGTPHQEPGRSPHSGATVGGCDRRPAVLCPVSGRERRGNRACRTRGPIHRRWRARRVARGRALRARQRREGHAGRHQAENRRRPRVQRVAGQRVAPAATAADAEKPATKTTPVSEQEKDRNDRQWPAIVAREANKAGLNVTPSGIKASG